MIKCLCVWWFIGGYNLCGVGCHIFIFCIFDYKYIKIYTKGKKKKKNYADIMCGNKLIPVN